AADQRGARAAGSRVLRRAARRPRHLSARPLLPSRPAGRARRAGGDAGGGDHGAGGAPAVDRVRQPVHGAVGGDRLRRSARQALAPAARRPGVHGMSLSVCLSFDFDAMSVWIAGTENPATISRGEFGAVAIPRILSLLERHGARATFFIPGHTALAYPF